MEKACGSDEPEASTATAEVATTTGATTTPKVHLDAATVLTTQLYFDDAVTARVYEAEPYASRSGRDTFNDGDGILDPALVMALSEQPDGYLGIASFDVAST